VPLELADHTILDTLERDLLTPPVLDIAVETAMALLRPDSAAAEAKRQGLLAEQAKVDGELGRLTEAVIEGGDVATFVKAIKTREQRKADIVSELALLAHVKAMEPGELQALQNGLRARLDDWCGLLRRQPIQGRQILRKLLVGRLTLTPEWLTACGVTTTRARPPWAACWPAASMLEPW